MAEKISDIVTSRSKLVPLHTEFDRSKEQWWMKYPTVIVNTDVQIFGSMGDNQARQLGAYAGDFHRAVAGSFSAHSCPAMLVDSAGRVLDKNHPAAGKQDQIDRSVIINPVFLGKFPGEVDEVLRFIVSTQGTMSAGQERECKEMLRIYIPEVQLPLSRPRIAQIGKKICRRLGIKQEVNPNFINELWVPDQFRQLHQLPPAWRRHINRMLLVKWGAFKEVVFPYQVDDTGNVGIEDPILATLEGGQPVLDYQTIARRMMVFGSSVPVGEYEIIKGQPIPKELWDNSVTVQGLIRLGRYLGQIGVLSKPVLIDELARSSRLASYVAEVAKYSRQAEGAWSAQAKDIMLALLAMGIDLGAIDADNVTGRFGALKHDPKTKDMSAVVHSDKPNTVAVRKIEGYETLPPSIEASEFEKRKKKKNAVRLSAVPGGFMEDPNGPIEVDPIDLVFHGHRDVTIRNRKVAAEVNLDLEEFPPFGCGVDLNDRMTEVAAEKAIELWKASGKTLKIIKVRVRNHSDNLFVMLTADENGVIPADSANVIIEAHQKGDIEFEKDVTQY